VIVCHLENLENVIDDSAAAEGAELADTDDIIEKIVFF
jgi:hypothetical protein